jgi:hypothetical protein
MRCVPSRNRQDRCNAQRRRLRQLSASERSLPPLEPLPPRLFRESTRNVRVPSVTAHLIEEFVGGRARLTGSSNPLHQFGSKELDPDARFGGNPG